MDDPKTIQVTVPAWAVRDAVLAMYELGLRLRSDEFPQVDHAAELYSTAARLESILEQAQEDV